MRIFSIYNRFIVRSITQVVLLFLCCIYFLYVLIDTSSRVSAFSLLSFDYTTLLLYYGVLFIRSFEVLFPFALLLGVLRTLQMVYKSNGWVALFTSGTAVRRLISPFILVGTISTLLLYFNEEFVLPSALKKLNYLESLYFHKGEGVGEMNQRISVKLRDGSRLFFQSMDALNHQLHDVYLIESWDQVWHMERLDVSQTPPIGYFVDELNRDEAHRLLQVNSYPAKSFEKSAFVFDDLMEMVSAPSSHSISQIVGKISSGVKMGASEYSENLSALLAKICMPLLGLIACLAPIPFAITFSRKNPMPLVYFFSVFGLLAFYLFVKAATVLANSSVIPPFIAIGIPFLAIFLILGAYTGRFLRHGSI